MFLVVGEEKKEFKVRGKVKGVIYNGNNIHFLSEDWRNG